MIRGITRALDWVGDWVCDLDPHAAASIWRAAAKIRKMFNVEGGK